MKIEKVNDHQIRCTLTKADLADRELKISELAYGTEKAKNLFRDMMQQASYEFGFEAEDIPLMIEAIPLSGDCIVLIITKVEDPEELDTRFSKFAPSVHDSDADDKSDFEDAFSSVSQGADDVLDLFKKLHNGQNDADDTEDESATEELSSQLSNKDLAEPETELPATVPINLTKLYSFPSLDLATRLAHVLGSYYKGENFLYRNPVSEKYFLVLRKSGHTPAEFNKICNITSEYASAERYTPAMEAFLGEHAELIISKDALQILASV